LLTVTFHVPHKRKRRKLLSATSTGTFPRIQVVPVFRPSPTHIIPNLPSMRKGADFVANDYEKENERNAA
jgi:hypothetical protein